MGQHEEYLERDTGDAKTQSLLRKKNGRDAGTSRTLTSAIEWDTAPKPIISGSVMGDAPKEEKPRRPNECDTGLLRKLKGKRGIR